MKILLFGFEEEITIEVKKYAWKSRKMMITIPCLAE